MKQLKQQILSLILLLFCATSSWALAAVTKFQVTSNKDNQSRLIFTATNRLNYLLFALANPNRLVLDIKDARITTKLNKHLLAKTPIKNIRIGSQKTNYLRIVMDLKSRIQPVSFQLTPNASEHNYRLIIDLKPSLNDADKTKPQLSLLDLPQPVMSAPKPIAVKTTPPPSVKRRDIVIVIDPGHGGKDPGTSGPSGVHEKNVVLSIAKALQRDLNNEPGFHAELTRDSDYYIPLRGRLDIARKDKADIFVSIHADAYEKSMATGASVFALSERGATSEAAHWLAEKENRSELLGGANLSNQDNILRSVLIDLSQTHTIGESLQIGTAVLHQLSAVALLHYNRVEQAAFVVLKSPDIPSILIETGFLSTPLQEGQLKDAHYQQKIANSIMLGIKSYFVHNPPQGTVFAMTTTNDAKFSFAQG